MFPVPFSEKLQAGSPGTVAEPFAVIGTVVPPLSGSCPDAEPLIVMLPAHSAEKSPASVVVWLVTRHWKFVHDAALGSPVSDCDVHVPRYDGVELFDPPLPLLPLEGAVGRSASLLLRSNAHAVARTETAATAIGRAMVLFIIVPLVRP